METPPPVVSTPDIVTLTEKLAHPAVILPQQFAGTTRRQAPRQTGEHHLLAAVLDEAVACYQRYLFATTRSGRRLFREAEQWLMVPLARRVVSSDEEAWFSFEYVCDVLDLDKDYLRRGLREWRAHQLDGACHQQATGT
jgi:hypothetical protein